MTIEQIARKLQTIRDDLSNAGARPDSRERINSLSIALELLTDVVEHSIAQQTAMERRIDAIGRSIRAIADRND